MAIWTASDENFFAQKNNIQKADSPEIIIKKGNKIIHRFKDGREESFYINDSVAKKIREKMI